MSYELVPATPVDFAVFESGTGYACAHNARGLVAQGRGGLGGMVLFDRWTPASAHAHILLVAPLALRRLGRAAAVYAFDALGLRVLFGVIPAHNTRSLNVASKLGFRETHRTPQGWDATTDVVHLELRRNHCRFLQET